MAFELLVAEASDLSEDSIMEVVRYIRKIKENAQRTDGDMSERSRPVVREAGKYRGQIVMTDGFDEPLDAFKEYM